MIYALFKERIIIIEKCVRKDIFRESERITLTDVLSYGDRSEKELEEKNKRMEITDSLYYYFKLLLIIKPTQIT